MAAGAYIKYAREAEYEPQSYYLESGSSYKVCDELRRLGTKRVLFVCGKTVSKYKNFTDLCKSFEKFGFRIFTYVRQDGKLTNSDITKGLHIYLEYNCDTIVAVGGSYEIDCSKMISAMATNEISDPAALVGIDRFKKDISVLCCIVTDNSSTAACSYAEFYDENAKKWSVAYSAFLIPQIVVVDTDIAMRTDIKIALDRAIKALVIAVEAYICPDAASFPEYRANAIDSFRSLNKYINLMMEDPEESYYRRRVAVGSLSAGVSSRMTGIGIAYASAHSILSRVNSLLSCVYIYILTFMISEADEKSIGRIAEFAYLTGVASVTEDEKSATESLLNALNHYLEFYIGEDITLDIADKEVSVMIAEVVKEAELFNIDPKIKGSVERIFRRLNSVC